jgi:carboxymethylenebutenolidase
MAELNNELSRRNFIVTTLTTGFALAVQPVTAQTITTDTQNLVTGEIKIPTTDGSIPAYHAMPTGTGPFPVIIVVQEIFGVHEYIKDVCRRLAKLGYMAIAPELFARQGDVSKMTEIKEIIEKVVSKVPDAQVMKDLDSTVMWAKSSGKGDVSKLGITGFCWGGRVVWLYSAYNPQVKAGVAWYGRLTNREGESQLTPISVGSKLRVPVLGLYGGEDTGIPVDTVEQMRKELEKSRSGSEIVVYPKAPHGFHADYRPSYRKEDAQDAWKRLEDWFKRKLAGPTVNVEYLFTARVDVDTPLKVGNTYQGERRIINITGGSFGGPQMRGTVLPGGADWQIVRADGAALLEARYTLRTDDDAIIYVRNVGIRRGPADVLAKLAAGEQVDPSTYYFRTMPYFETGSEKYSWLNDSIFVATGKRDKSVVTIDFFRVT